MPDRRWEHDPTIQNFDGNTVAHIFARVGVVPPV